jgi:hypothetical protein
MQAQAAVQTLPTDPLTYLIRQPSSIRQLCSNHPGCMSGLFHVDTRSTEHLLGAQELCVVTYFTAGFVSKQGHVPPIGVVRGL